ncbi:MAG TPA: methylthioribulose 1-phosphate dehydratase [Xanthomonadales bacterium]|nr:methylthioribulose 1-phosphate dehydratase [Xanthomonadales bacterium]
MPKPSQSRKFKQLADELVSAGQYLHSQGAVPATSGNLSARLDKERIAITRSGCHKGHLEPADIMQVDLQGQSLDGNKPSAETALHTSLYALYPGLGAVLHSHSPAAVLASRLFEDAVIIEDAELLKALRGITTHETDVIVPIFDNSQDIAELAEEVEGYLAACDETDTSCYGYIIAGHGLYTWGESVAEALRHVEALEFLLNIENRVQGVKR